MQRARDFVGDRQLLEVAAGSGLWARLLTEAGVPVVATDSGAGLQPAWFPVEIADAQIAVRSHPECTVLLLCWPPFNETCAFRALGAFKGDLLVYVGDPRFTADKAFHDLLRKSWQCHETIPLPSWPGLDDGLHLYVRRDRVD